MAHDDRYSHRFHAGNVGDVWKHCVLSALLDALVARSDALYAYETHAGCGRYLLGPTRRPAIVPRSWR